MITNGGIPLGTRSALLVGGCAMVAAAFLATVHVGEDHCALEGPDHQCELCRAFDGNPLLAIDLPTLGTPHDATRVDDAGTPDERRIDLPFRSSRAPPAPVHVT